MRRCLELAREAAARGEVPVGAIVVRDGVVLGEGHNLCEERGDATQHAELVALRAAFVAAGEGRLPGAVVYCTLEPRFMCAGAILLVVVTHFLEQDRTLDVSSLSLGVADLLASGLAAR